MFSDMQMQGCYFCRLAGEIGRNWQKLATLLAEIKQPCFDEMTLTSVLASRESGSTLVGQCGGSTGPGLADPGTGLVVQLR